MISRPEHQDDNALLQEGRAVGAPADGLVSVSAKVAPRPWPKDPGSLRADSVWCAISELTDLGNATRIAWRLQDQIRYVIGRKIGLEWIVWSGRVWEEGTDAENSLRRIAMRHLREGAAWVTGLLEANERASKDTQKFVKHCSSLSGMSAAIKVAAMNERLVVHESDLDAHSHLLNTPSCVVDFRDLSFKPHDPALLLTKITNAPYEAEAHSPAFYSFLNLVCRGDPNQVEAVKISLGLSLYGQHWSRGHMLNGETGTGKSTMFRILTGTLGGENQGYTCEVKWPTIGKKEGSGLGSDHDAGLASLHGKRLGFVYEVPERASLGARYKQMVDDEFIVYRSPYGRTQERLRLETSIFIACNSYPGVPEGEGAAAVIRKTNFLPFNQQFVEASDERIQLEPDRFLAQDAALVARMYAGDGKPGPEGAGILAELVRGAARWWKNREIPKSAAAEKFLNTFREDQKRPLEDFLDDVVELAPGGFVSKEGLYAAYYGWAGANGIKHPLKNVGRGSFGAVLGQCTLHSDRYGGDRIQRNANEPRTNDQRHRPRGKGYVGVALSKDGLALRAKGNMSLTGTASDQQYGLGYGEQ